MSDYYIHVLDENDTVQSICNQYGINAKEATDLNSTLNPELNDESIKSDDKDTRNLTYYRLYNKPLKSITLADGKHPTMFLVPTEYNTNSNNLRLNVPYASLEDIGNGQVEVVNGVIPALSKGRKRIPNANLPALDSWTPPPHKGTNSTVQVFHGGIKKSPVYYIPFPTNITDSNTASFSGTSVFRRSVSYQTYQTSGRSLSFTLDFHEDMYYPGHHFMHHLIKCIQSALYPKYEGNVVLAPSIKFKFGDQFVIYGILSNCSTDWDGPIMKGYGNRAEMWNGHIVHCTMSLSVDEISGPWDVMTLSNHDLYKRE